MRGLAVAAIALGVIVVSLRWGSFVAGGSDSYCYVHQAERWADVFARPLTARLQVPEPLAAEAPWPQAGATFTPTGHVPSRTVPGAIVPICPAGVSMLMAPLLLAGGPSAAFLIIPLFGALLVVATYAAGSRFGARVGVGAACLVACSPIVLYQVVQPMSDVPAAALWVAAVAWATGTKRRDIVLAGAATSLAILVRPNLLPLGFVIGAFLLLRPERTTRQRVRETIAFAIACVPGCIAVAVIHLTLYGSPLSSGYGAYDALFAVDHVGPNASRYLTWLLQSHTPAIALAVLVIFLLPGPLTMLLLALFAANLAIYLPYVVFEDWSFVRFLLPTIPLLSILMVAAADAILRRIVARLVVDPANRAGAMRLANAALAVMVVVLGIVFVRQAQARNAFRLQFLEARFERAGRYVAAQLPAHALVVTSYESGSVRFYGHRRTLEWSALDPAWLDRSLDFMRSRGYQPYLLFERWEEPEFRRRFAASALGALDWPPFAEIAGQVRVYRPEDRERYLRGEVLTTSFVP